jgi:hypothetical protein
MKRKYPLVYIHPGLSFDGQQFIDTRNGEKHIWFVNRLVVLAKDLPVFDIPLAGVNTYNLQPKDEGFNSWITHIKKVNDADLSFPIILDDEGYVMDGRHRIAKAILEGRKTIKAVRFPVTPPCDFVKVG